MGPPGHRRDAPPARNMPVPHRTHRSGVAGPSPVTVSTTRRRGDMRHGRAGAARATRTRAIVSPRLLVPDGYVLRGRRGAFLRHAEPGDGHADPRRLEATPDGDARGAADHPIDLPTPPHAWPGA